MTKPKKPDTDEISFQDLMRGVKPLSHSKITLRKNKPALKKIPTKPEKEIGFPFSDYEKLPLVTSEERLEFARSGIQHKMLRKIRQGQYNAEAILDLHGKTVTEAREVLSEFLLECQQQGLRHALIIHGKGRDAQAPILKNKLNHWLRQTEQVLVFCTATPKHGGSGALYVLLRR